MRVGVVERPRDPFSIAGYRRHVVAGLEASGVGCVAVGESGPVPDCDVLWDPGLGMRRVPGVLVDAPVPVVATVHGLRAFSLPWRETGNGLGERLRQRRLRGRVARGWRRLGERVRAVIAVSRYGAREVEQELGLPAALVHAIHHGVDHGVFRPEGPAEEGTYLLAVAQYQPKKNLDRLLAAYAELAAPRPGLVVVAPGFPAGRPVPDGVRLVREGREPEEIARLLRGAIAFACPSLHETFGMPLVEAMACGCPVLTADTTACPEVTGDAALHVDPRSVAAIRAGLERLVADAGLRGELRARGRARARGFTWERSAAAHREVLAAAREVAVP